VFVECILCRPSCRSLYQAKITEGRARGPPNFVALPRNLFRIAGRPDPASKFPSGSAVRIYVRIPWSLCDLALILALPIGWFQTFQGSIGCEIHDLSITASDDVAFCHSLNRISGTRTGGDKTDVWVRATIGCRRFDGMWLISHEHASVPFYMDGSDRAAIDLKP